MSNERECERCGQPLSGAASDGICPASVAQPGQVSWLSDPEEAAAEAATALHPLALRENAGTIIGRYKLLEQLGEGGFGESQSQISNLKFPRVVRTSSWNW